MVKFYVQVFALVIIWRGICQVGAVSISDFYKLNASGQIYLVSKYRQGYQSANSSCANIQTQLATFYTQSDYSHIVDIIKNMKSTFRFYRNNRFWINFVTYNTYQSKWSRKWQHKNSNYKNSYSTSYQLCPRLSSYGLKYSYCSDRNLFLCQCLLNCTELYNQTSEVISDNNTTCEYEYDPSSVFNGTCVEDDECSNADCDHNCTNTNSSYRCECYDGYMLNASDSRTCDDIDECIENSTLCEQKCFNTPGSYLCYCPLGYKLASDGRSCELYATFKSCACYCSRGNALNISEQLAIAQMSLGVENKTEALRYKRSLSSFRRTVTCAEDERKEASAVGSLGIILIVVSVCAFVAPDVVGIISFLVAKLLILKRRIEVKNNRVQNIAIIEIQE